MSNGEKPVEQKPAVRTFVVKPAPSQAKPPQVTVVKKAAPKPKWVITANVAPPKKVEPRTEAADKPAVLTAPRTGTASGPVAPNAPAPMTSPTLPPNLEALAVRVVRPMIGEWLEENMPRILGR